MRVSSNHHQIEIVGKVNLLIPNSYQNTTSSLMKFLIKHRIQHRIDLLHILH